ncbi:MAG: hypothetical protein FJ297_05495 [Planctomycetes bacterium]|nr:hypothetical protein [Planctomycetota bacterium]
MAKSKQGDLRPLRPFVVIVLILVPLGPGEPFIAAGRSTDPPRTRSHAGQPLSRSRRDNDIRDAAIVVAAVRRAARRHATSRREPGDGDRLTEECVRAAAEASGAIEAPRRAAAFLTGLGIAFDDSGVLRSNLFVGPYCREVESVVDPHATHGDLNGPTIRGRGDLARHFFTCAFLTSRLNAAAAEAAGVGKEWFDARGGSGFSFADLAADRAGIALARWAHANPDGIPPLADRFRVVDFAPAIDGLPEGLDPGALERLAIPDGSNATAQERLFRAIDDRIRSLPPYARVPVP